MPEAVSASEVNSDPSVTKQYDNETPMDKQFQDLYSTVDGLKIGLMGTYRPGVGPVARSMAISKRIGPDFLFITNKNSQKMKDLEKGKECQITFQNSSNQDWVSISGTCVTTDNSDPRIKDLYNSGVKAWFGDLGDGVHNGSAEDPRVTLLEVKAKYIAYWMHNVGALGYMKEVAGAAMTGKVAQTGVLREVHESDIEKARSLAKA